MSDPEDAQNEANDELDNDNNEINDYDDQVVTDANPDVVVSSSTTPVSSVVESSSTSLVDEYDDDEPLEDYVVKLVVNGEPDSSTPSVKDIVDAGITDSIGDDSKTSAVIDAINGYTSTIVDELAGNGTAITGGEKKMVGFFNAQLDHFWFNCSLYYWNNSCTFILPSWKTWKEQTNTKKWYNDDNKRSCHQRYLDRSKIPTSTKCLKKFLLLFLFFLLLFLSFFSYFLSRFLFHFNQSAFFFLFLSRWSLLLSLSLQSVCVSEGIMFSFVQDEDDRFMVLLLYIFFFFFFFFLNSYFFFFSNISKTFILNIRTHKNITL